METIRTRAMTTIIRAARTFDAPAIAALCGELGYPSTRQQVVSRLAAIEASADGSVFVAESVAGTVVGWLQAARGTQLTSDGDAEILGLVVTAAHRGQGIGAALVAAAERWALACGCGRLRVRSRSDREAAHRFYERAGYQRIKAQVMFGKALR
jgi:GNAT superfamily N-acetyltransferase